VFDLLTIAAITDELTGSILDGRVQRVGMISRRSIGMEVYAGGRRRYLVASAENDDARLLLLDREPSFDSQLVTPLLLLLRKYVRGGIVVAIEQPPLDRVVRLSIAKRLGPHNDQSGAGEDRAEERAGNDEDDQDGLEEATFVHLIVEIMGRHSNIILVDDDGRIMEAVKRVTPAMSRVRPIAPKLRYADAPSGDRGDPRRLSTAETAMLLAAERPNAPIATLLPRRLRGVSPQMAREVVFQALGSTDATVAQAGDDGPAAIAREMRRLLEPLLTSAWSPQVYLDRDREPAAFAAVPHEHLAVDLEPESVPSISRAAELASSSGDDAAPGKHSQRRARLQEAIGEAMERVRARRVRLQQEAEKGKDADRYRRWGELVYAYLWSISPGQSELDADGEKIPLDPRLSGKENAQEYFERYRLAQSAGSHLPELIEQADTELAYLDQLLTLAGQAETFPELEDATVEWEAYQRPRDATGVGLKRPRPRSSPPRRPKAIVDRNGNAIYIGRSGPENDRITFDIAGPNDTWLHARGVPGSHVIVRWNNPAGDEDDDTLDTAAALAAYYSGRRESGSVDVDITRRRHVRKIKGTGPGMVTYRNERTVAVRPASEVSLQSRLRAN
jgi:predicted ribosome quality control (RQC) complex YloA/Tae2 family protein